MKLDYETFDLLKRCQINIWRLSTKIERIAHLAKINDKVRDNLMREIDVLIKNVSLDDECKLFEESDTFKRHQQLIAELNNIETSPKTGE